MGRFLISYTKSGNFLKKGEVLFWCNTAEDMNSAYEELKKIICRIFNQSMSQSETNSLALNSLYYQMLNLLQRIFCCP